MRRPTNTHEQKTGQHEAIDKLRSPIHRKKKPIDKNP